MNETTGNVNQQFAHALPRVPKKPFSHKFRGYLPKGKLVSGPLDYFMLNRVPFALWVHFRRFKYGVLNAILPKKSSAEDGFSAHDKANTIPHNQPQIGRITRHRTERLINILRSMSNLKLSNLDVLCIGPRNEAEVLLFKLYGFSLKRLKAIDLFSYSPLIDVMDMHNLEYKDNSFDLVYSSYVVRYSDNLAQACKEKIRVLRDGGIVVVGFVTGGIVTNIVGSELKNGFQDLLVHFEGHVRHVYWHEEAVTEDGTLNCTAIFSIKK